MEYDISLIMEDEPKRTTAIDLVPKSEENRMKVLCMQLSNGNIEHYQKLYSETPIYDVYELMTLQNAINYRLEDEPETDV